MALNENLPASTFLLYFTAVSGFTAWITGILNEFAALRKESLDLNTIREYLDVPEPFRFEGGVPIPDLSGGCEIKLEKVSFRYPDAEKDTIHDLDLTIALDHCSGREACYCWLEWGRKNNTCEVDLRPA